MRKKKNTNECLDILGSMEDYYQFKNPLQLAKLILDKQKSRKYFFLKQQLKIKKFSSNSLRGTFQMSDIQKLKQQHQQQLEKIAQENSIFQLDQQYSDLQHISSEVKKILRLKQQKDLFSEKERQLVWLLATKSQYQKSHNLEYYASLNICNEFPDSHYQYIVQDVVRTSPRGVDIYEVQKNKELKKELQEHREKMERILYNYSKRNSTVGYCQGLNYVVSTLLELQFSEEDTFWILTDLIESIIPLDYYPSIMLGVMCDQKIFNNLLQVHNPQLFKKLEDNEITTGLFLTEWFVCLYSNTLDFQVLKVVWDHLFLKGSVTIFKVGLIILDMAQQDLEDAEDRKNYIQNYQSLYNIFLVQILQVIQETARNIKDAQLFNKKLNELYISKKGVKVLREIYRQTYEIENKEKLQQESNKSFGIASNTLVCNNKWPVCSHKLLHQKYTIEPYQFIFKIGQQLDIKHNHFKEIKNIEIIQENSNKISQRFPSRSLKKKIIHNNNSCIIQSNQMHESQILRVKSISNDEINNEQDFFKSQELQRKLCDEIMMIRSDHICPYYVQQQQYQNGSLLEQKNKQKQSILSQKQKYQEIESIVEDSSLNNNSKLLMESNTNHSQLGNYNESQELDLIISKLQFRQSQQYNLDSNSNSNQKAQNSLPLNLQEQDNMSLSQKLEYENNVQELQQKTPQKSSQQSQQFFKFSSSKLGGGVESDSKIQFSQEVDVNQLSSIQFLRSLSVNKNLKHLLTKQEDEGKIISAQDLDQYLN